MIVNGNGERLLRACLADHVVIQVLKNLFRSRDRLLSGSRLDFRLFYGRRSRLFPRFIREERGELSRAVIADENPVAAEEVLHLPFPTAAEYAFPGLVI